jgi:hypothetical protein
LPPEGEPALIRADAIGEFIGGRGERTRPWYEGENFIIGCYDPGEKPQGVDIDLFGYRVSVKTDTLLGLTGRTLTLRAVNVRSGWFWKETKHVLVAT